MKRSDMIPEGTVSDEAQVPELPDDVAALLGDARTLRGPTPDVHARLRDRLRALPPPDGGGSSGMPSAGLPKIPLWAAAAVFVAGIGVGALLPRTPASTQASAHAGTEASPPTRTQSSASTRVEVPAVAVATPTVSSAPVTVELAALPSVPAHASSAPAHASDLAAERALLDVARTALGRGDGVLALEPCEEHARKFPSGALVEEREAIAIQALVLANRRDEARPRAERFRKRHPRSILLPAVLAAAALSP